MIPRLTPSLSTELYFISYGNQHGRLTTTCPAHIEENADQHCFEFGVVFVHDLLFNLQLNNTSSLRIKYIKLISYFDMSLSLCTKIFNESYVQSSFLCSFIIEDNGFDATKKEIKRFLLIITEQKDATT